MKHTSGWRRGAEPEELQIHANDANLARHVPESRADWPVARGMRRRGEKLVEAYNKDWTFSLIDKEKIKDSIRQAIKADELFQSMVDGFTPKWASRSLN